MKNTTKQIRWGRLALATCLTSALAMTSSITPSQAHPPMLPGINKGTVLMMRDQANKVAFDQKASSAEAPETKSFSYIKTIVLDPGHGGENQGAIGTAHVHEKFLTMELAYLLRDMLQQTYPEARIVMTRYWDKEMSLSDRIHMANKIDADLFISLHYNAAVHDRAVGVETYFLATEQAIPGGEPPKSKPIASAAPTVAGMNTANDPTAEKPQQGTYNDALATLQRDLERAAQHKQSGMLAEVVQRHLVHKTRSINRGVKQANFGVLRGALMPAIVVEAGFVTHPDEGKKVLAERHRASVATALFQAIEEFDVMMAKQASN